MHFLKYIVLGISVLLISEIFPACESGRQEIIPYVKVDRKLLLYADLADMGIGDSKIIDGGVSGIVLYRESDLVFHAFDRTCTEYPEHLKAVVAHPDFFGVFQCPECNSTYMLMNGGQPNSGPSQHSLVEYYAILQGDILHIHN